MPTRTLTYQDEAHAIALTLGPDTVLAGVKRALLQGRAVAYIEALPADGATTVDQAAQRLIAQYIYPDLLACVVAAEGLDPEMGVADFLALPQGLTDAWQNLAYELIPQWYPFQTADAEAPAEAEKKGVTPSADSASS